MSDWKQEFLDDRGYDSVEWVRDAQANGRFPIQNASVIQAFLDRVDVEASAAAATADRYLQRRSAEAAQASIVAARRSLRTSRIALVVAVAALVAQAWAFIEADGAEARNEFSHVAAGSKSCSVGQLEGVDRTIAGAEQQR